MHEYSVVASLIEICLQHLQAHNAQSVQTITISVGQRANIEQSLLISAFEVLKTEYSELSQAKIAIITEKLTLECKDCDYSFCSLDNPICPNCQSTNTHIVAGRDIKLENLELEIEGE